ncbi:FxSxx-COOH system tetratricopeptide repeat protein [Krasilnikovia sp. M28-CT-15]|uniref:FxSxx-COOH system tetratricopeptide repeat protein n=1 Tax=Krasilnikovia sp. M28-CT-15 TaxID=3373540 RepID=UPI00399C7F1C
MADRVSEHDPTPEDAGASTSQHVVTSGNATSASVASGVQVNVYPGSPPQPTGTDRPRSAASEDRRTVHNLAHRDRNFIGREAQLDQLHERLVSGGAAVVQAVHGMGGIGKTQLVLEYAHRHLSGYEVVWWISAEQTGLIGDQFTALGVRLGIIDTHADTLVAQSKVLEYLSGREGWLLIFDNAVRREDILPWLPQDSGHVLITSRGGNWHQTAQVMELNVLAREDAIRFLTRQLPALEVTEADALADALGNLPLALAQAGGYLAETGMSVVDYRQALLEETQAVLELGAPINYPRSLAAAVTLSVNALSEDDPAALAILRLCAFLAPEPISGDLIAAIAAHGPCPELLVPLQAEIDKPLARQRHIGRISVYGLARIELGSITVHRLVQAIVRCQLEPSAAAELSTHLESAIGAMNPGNPRDSASWPAWSRLLPHLLAIEPGRSSNPALREHARDAIVYLISRGDNRSAQRFAKSLHAEWALRLGPDHRDTLRAATELVWALRNLGDIGRLPALIDDTLTRQIKAFGRDDPDTLRTAADLAVVQSALGHYLRARETDEDVLERRRRVLGEDHPDTLTAAGNLAAAVGNLGRYEEALELARDVLERRRRVLGEDHLSTLAAAANFALAVGKLGRYEKALELKRDVLERHRRVLGEDHPSTLTASGNHASAVGELGRYQEALELHRDVLERHRRVLGEDHPDTLAAAGNFAAAVGELGRHVEALELKRDVLDRYQRVLGEDHPSTLTAAGNLAATVGALGMHEEALELLRDVLQRHRRVLGEDHPDTLTAAANFSSMLGELGRHDEVLELKRDVLDRCRRVLGGDHPDTFLAMLNLAITLAKLRQILPARRLADQSFGGLRAKLGAQHPHTQRAGQLRNQLAGLMGGRRVRKGPKGHR